MLNKLNLGSGETYLEDFINIDLTSKVKCDVVGDIRAGLPFENEKFNQINALHVLEHIEFSIWPNFFAEIQRLLTQDGLLILAYPEFERCALNFISNHKGARDFWRKTLFGRQAYPGDYHVVPMRTEEVINYLSHFGFIDIKYTFEDEEEWNTFLTARRGPILKSRVELLRAEIFG